MWGAPVPPESPPVKPIGRERNSPRWLNVTVYSSNHPGERTEGIRLVKRFIEEVEEYVSRP